MTFPIRLSLIITTCLTIMLGGCSIQTGSQAPADIAKSDALQVEKLIAEADNSAPIKSARLKAEAARILVRLDRRTDAANLLEEIDLTLLAPALRFEIAELKARAALDREDGISAMRYLQQLPEDKSSLPIERQYQIGQMQADAYRFQQDNLSEAQQLIQLSSLTPQADKQALHDRIWSVLLALPSQQLDQLSLRPNNTYQEQGWYELAHNAKTATDLTSQSIKQEQWKILWQSHPAFELPPSNLQTLASAEQIDASHIALLLPLSGKLEKPAEAIMTGFMSAYYNTMRNGEETSTVTMLDSSQINTPELLYQVTQEKQIDLIVGPLEKDFVNQLINYGSFDIPILTLNVVAGSMQQNIYQFGLAIEDEAIQAAEQAWQDGHRQMLVYTPDTDWGIRAQLSFSQHFEALGGTVLTTINHQRNANYSEDIAQLLGTGASIERSKKIAQTIGARPESEDRRRQDIDAIFLSALPEAARQIKPTLAFHYAGRIPVYATSHVYSGVETPIRDQDLNGIRFVATPWLVEEPSSLHLQLAQQRDNTNSRFGRLYALGIDAFQLYPYLAQLAAFPNTQVNGESGILTIPHNNHIQRHLTWSTFRDGKPQPIK
ncbi:MAG: penicillin-binding protein activator [Amphritea sp.]